jgi:hypothetical protein
MSADKIINYFSILKKHNSISSSYLFIGENAVLVKPVLKLINCANSQDYFCDSCFDCRGIENNTHPDLFIVEPDNFNISIEKIKECQQFLRLKTFQAKRKIALIVQAQNLSDAAANAFLKTLEEPAKNSFIAICVSKIDGVLPTIISRCKKIFLPPGEPQIDTRALNLAFSFLKGASVQFKDRFEFSSFVWALALILRDNLVSSIDNNNHLLTLADYEIISSSLRLRQTVGSYSILRDILEIYSSCATINENLALNLIKGKLS